MVMIAASTSSGGPVTRELPRPGRRHVMMRWVILAVARGLLALNAAPLRAAELIATDQPAAAQIFARSQANAGTWKLLRFYDTQIDQAFCGVAASEIVLNSLGVPSPASPDIYPHSLFNQNNFFTEKVLKIKPEALVRRRGLQLDELDAMLATFGVKIDVYHADRIATLDEFRRVASAALGNPGERVIINYLRDALGQQGGGHFSPLAAYDAGSDRFLILDVARYKLPPVWVTAADLWGAVDTVDGDSHLKRGLLVVSAP